MDSTANVTTFTRPFPTEEPQPRFHRIKTPKKLVDIHGNEYAVVPMTNCKEYALVDLKIYRGLIEAGYSPNWSLIHHDTRYRYVICPTSPGAMIESGVWR